MNRMNIQPGHIARHTPNGAGSQGREAAVIDIAQDLLLNHLQVEGILDSFAIKGGTALRKLYAGKEGRFSLDLDFAKAPIDGSCEAMVERFVEICDGLQLGPFRYGIRERRGKWSVTLESPFGSESSLATKLDFSAPPWLEPELRMWVQMPIHAQYGFALPSIKAVRLEENIAEKITRLNRTTTARDMYDLAWIARTASVWQALDLSLIRKLALLKNWVDANGLHAVHLSWEPGHEAFPFDVERWLRLRTEKEFDMQDIGALAVPVPTAIGLLEAVRTSYTFLTDMDEDEQTLAAIDERDRTLALKMIEGLPGGRLSGIGLY